MQESASLHTVLGDDANPDTATAATISRQGQGNSVLDEGDASLLLHTRLEGGVKVPPDIGAP